MIDTSGSGVDSFIGRTPHRKRPPIIESDSSEDENNKNESNDVSEDTSDNDEATNNLYQNPSISSDSSENEAETKITPKNYGKINSLKVTSLESSIVIDSDSDNEQEPTLHSIYALSEDEAEDMEKKNNSKINQNLGTSFSTPRVARKQSYASSESEDEEQNIVISSDEDSVHEVCLHIIQFRSFT